MTKFDTTFELKTVMTLRVPVPHEQNNGKYVVGGNATNKLIHTNTFRITK